MSQVKTRKLLIIYTLIIGFVFQLVSINRVEGQGDAVSKINEMLIGVSEEERQVLQELFILLQEMEAIEVEEKKVTVDIEILNKEANKLEKMIQNETALYKRRQNDLKQVLRSYQRMGAGSYLKIILESESLTGLIRRINIIRDITRNTGELLEHLDRSKEKLEKEQLSLAEKLSLMQEKQSQLNESLERKSKAKDNMEEYLASLAEEREHYEEYLKNIQLVWDDLKTTFSEASREFSRIIKEENISSDTLKLNLTLLGIKGTIDEISFNNIIKDHAKIPEIEFHFLQDKIEMRLPEKSLVLSGTFVILDNSTLKFEVMEGKFYGMSLESSSIEELFNEGHILLDLKPLIGDNRLRSIQIIEGYIELLVIPVLR